MPFRRLVGHIFVIPSETVSALLLCDFPSKLIDPPFRCHIFGLDDLPYFVQSIAENCESEVIVITQQSFVLKNFYHLAYHLLPNFNVTFAPLLPCPMNLKSLKFYTLFLTILSLRHNHLTPFRHFPFPLEIKRTTINYSKAFDLFMLQQDLTKNYTSLLINNPIFHIHGYYFSSNFDLISQDSVVLTEHAIKHSYKNPLQALLP